MKPLPQVIQGGMGIAVSSWKMAQAVSRAGGLGVVSGTAIDSVIARRLQDGDADGSVRRALVAYPDQEFAKDALRRFFIEGGKAAETPYLACTRFSMKVNELAKINS